MNSLKFYELSQKAKRDLEDIIDYTLSRYGEEQAVIYSSDISKVFRELTENPKIGKSRPEIRSNLRSFTKGSHTIYYRVFSSKIRIIRILHVNRDVTQHFHVP